MMGTNITRVQPDPAPDLDELGQISQPVPDARPVDANAGGPVHTHEMPSRTGSINAVPITNAEYVRILNRDPRRKRAQLVAAQTFRIARQKTISGTETLWPASVPLVISSMDELWVKSSQSSDTLTVIEEVWAD